MYYIFMYNMHTISQVLFVHVVVSITAGLPRYCCLLNTKAVSVVPCTTDRMMSLRSTFCNTCTRRYYI